MPPQVLGLPEVIGIKSKYRSLKEVAMEEEDSDIAAQDILESQIQQQNYMSYKRRSVRI